jgi:hypothetical protein
LNRTAVALVLAAAATPAIAQFSSDPANQLVVANQGGDQNQPKIRLAGGSFSVSYLSTQGTGWDTWIQRLSSTGGEQLVHNGIVSDDTNFSSTEDYGLAIDGAGNTIVAFRDDHTGITQIGVQKVAPDGSLPWGSFGVTVSAATVNGDVHTPNVVIASDGTYVVNYSRGSPSRAWFQKVDPAGNLLWGGGAGVNIAPATNGYIAAGMVAGDNGSVISAMYTFGSFTVSRRVHAQKLDGATGAQLWNSGTPIILQTASTLQSGNWPAVISDGNNGLIAAWYETATGAFMCRAQHVDSSGNQLFPAGGAAVAGTTGRLRVSPWPAYDAASGSTYMLYTESNTLQSLWAVYGQRLDASGNRQWGDGGLALMADSSFQPSFCRVVTTPGGVIGAWFMGTNAASSTMVVQAAKIADGGTLSWPGGIITVNSNGAAAKTRMDAVATSDGGAVIVYGDGTGGSLDIRASRINADGSLGNPVLPCGSADFDCDGDIGTDADIEAFFACLAGNCPSAPCASNADFNGDGDIGTDGDIEAFFRVLGGGTC